MTFEASLPFCVFNRLRHPITEPCISLHCPCRVERQSVLEQSATHGLPGASRHTSQDDKGDQSRGKGESWYTRELGTMHTVPCSGTIHNVLENLSVLTLHHQYFSPHVCLYIIIWTGLGLQKPCESITVVYRRTRENQRPGICGLVSSQQGLTDAVSR